MFEAFVGEQIGQLLSDGLDQLRIGDVMVDEGGDAVYIPWREKTLQLWKQSFYQNKNRDKKKKTLEIIQVLRFRSKSELEKSQMRKVNVGQHQLLNY